MAPTTQNQWTSTNTEGGFEKALQLDTHAAVPEVGDNDVLVKCMPILFPSLSCFVSKLILQCSPRRLT